jgi:REP element-mobilizing transposase RayT
MARLPRLKVQEGVGWYHLYSRVAGWLDWFPFDDDPLARQQLLRILRRYLSVYCCRAAGYSLMGNHYHLIVRFAPFRHLTHQQLYRRAQRIYSDPDCVLRTPRQWQRFHRRLFDVSEFMRNVQQAYTKWYNRHYNRRGSFWADRFESSILADENSLLNALLYVELNPVRAGLVERPEQWHSSSARLRFLREDSWLVPLEELLLEATPQEKLYRDYRALLYYRGAIRSQEPQAVIPPEILQAEEARGFRRPGAYRQRLAFFRKALVLGTQLQVEQWIRDLRRKGYYLRRRYAIPQWVDQAPLHTLREQRSLPQRA